MRVVGRRARAAAPVQLVVRVKVARRVVQERVDWRRWRRGRPLPRGGYVYVHGLPTATGDVSG